ncbi:helix-turn-helix domain-containing protein [uncultured Ruthenibacterium sp.]
MDNVKTGDLIRALRKEKNMTQKELACLLHVTDRAVSKWERGVSHS